MNNLNIRSKILSGYLMLLALMVIVSVILLISLTGMVNSFTFVVNHDIPVIEKGLTLEKLLVDAETGERGYLLSGDEAFLEPYNAALAQFDTVYNELYELVSDNPPQQQRLRDLKSSYQDWLNVVIEPIVEMRGQVTSMIENPEDTDAVTMEDVIAVVQSGSGKNRMDGMRATLDEFIQIEFDLNQQRVDDAQQQVNQVIVLVIGLTIASVIIGLVVGVSLGNGISRNVRVVMEAAQRVASGDLNQSINLNSNDELGKLAEAFNVMAANLRTTMASQVAKEYLENIINQYRDFVSRVAKGDLTARLQLQNGAHNQGASDDLYQLGENLNAMVANLSNMTVQVRETATSLAAAAAEILAATTQQIASATEQDVAVTQTMATVEEVRVTVSQAADRAQNVADTSRQSVTISRGGQGAVSDSVNGMKVIRQRVESIAENILLLSERTQQIGEIINTVNEIADQSKLLALNASIEAARAGEEGRGFAVVAMEVRQLAEQSREATARVRDILSEIQQATNTAVMVTEEGSKGAESGMTLVERAGESIRELAATIEEAAQAAMQIAASTRQQINGMDQLSMAMSSIKQASTQAAASTRQAERSAQDLNEMARRMQETVALYKV